MLRAFFPWHGVMGSSDEHGLEFFPALTRAARAIGLAGLECVSAGFTVWLLFSREVLPGYFHDNRLIEGQRRIVFIDLGVALAVGAAFAAAVLFWKGRAGLEILERLARRLAPLVLVWLIPFVFDRRLWVDEDLLVLPIVVAGAWGLVAALRTRWETAPAFPALAGLWTRVRPRLALVASTASRLASPLVVVSLGAAAYGVYFSWFTINNHRNLHTHGYDLGIFDNLMWHVLRPEIPLLRSTPAMGPTGTHFGRHATLFAYVIAPIYAILPHPETLLVLQALVLGAAAIPLFLYAKRHLPPWTAAIVAWAYLVYPPLHGGNLYDFHFLSLGPFFLWLTLYAVESKKGALTVLAVVSSLLMREDVAACLAVVGLFLLLSGTAARTARAGALIATAGGSYFLLMKFVLMPRLGPTDTAPFLIQYMGLVPGDDGGMGGVLKTVAGNPAFTANVVLTREKVTYCLELFAPVLLLPLTRPIGFLLVLPGFFFTLLSTGYVPLYETCFQYTSYWTAFVFIGVVVALEHGGKARFPGDRSGLVRRRSLVAGLVAASLAGTYLGGAILNREDVRGGFDRMTFGTTDAELRNRADLAALIAQIPPDGKVVASDHLVPHVSGRDYAYTLNQGLYDADWLLFQTTFIGDEKRNALQALTEDSFGVIDDRGGLVLAKRGVPSAAANFAVLRRLLH